MILIGSAVPHDCRRSSAMLPPQCRLNAVPSTDLYAYLRERVIDEQSHECAGAFQDGSCRQRPAPAGRVLLRRLHGCRDGRYARCRPSPRGAGILRRSRRRGDAGRGQHLGLDDGRGPEPHPAADSARHTLRGSLRGVLQPARPGGRRQRRRRQQPSRPAQLEFARLGIRHRFLRHRGHQQSRDRRCQRHQRDLPGRLAPEGGDRRQGFEGRSRRAQGEVRQAAQGGDVRRFRVAPRRATG